MIIKDTAPGGDQGAAGNGRSAGSQDNPNPIGWEAGSLCGSALAGALVMAELGFHVSFSVPYTASRYRLGVSS
jgi:hypothetical protein